MWDEWRVSLEIMIMHSRSQREACSQGGAGAARVCVRFMGNVVFACLRQEIWKSPRSFWLLIGCLVFNKTVNYWVSPQRAGRRRPRIHSAHEPGWRWVINPSVDFATKSDFITTFFFFFNVVLLSLCCRFESPSDDKQWLRLNFTGKSVKLCLS